MLPLSAQMTPTTSSSKLLRAKCRATRSEVSPPPSRNPNLRTADEPLCNTLRPSRLRTTPAFLRPPLPLLFSIPSPEKIFETEHALAFLDAFPMTRGHALLIPKAPGYATIMDMPEEMAANVLKELPRLARAVKAATGAEGVNIIQNNGRAAGQARAARAGPRARLAAGGLSPPSAVLQSSAYWLPGACPNRIPIASRSYPDRIPCAQVVFHAHFHVVPRNSGDELIRLGSHGGSYRGRRQKKSTCGMGAD